jgi:hypothetical protein
VKGSKRAISCQLAIYGAKCAIKEQIMSASNFSSVKLPAELVQQARDAAQPLRRSAAGQIEYWATLGRVVEHSGLTELEARVAIELYEAREDSQARELTARFIATEEDGGLAERVRQVIAENRKLATVGRDLQ